MPQPTLIDELSAGYHNKLADIELGKNLHAHFMDVSQCIHKLNELIDSCEVENHDLPAFMIMAYHYYRLKERLVSAMMVKE